jgi:hypothetical protein
MEDVTIDFDQKAIIYEENYELVLPLAAGVAAASCSMMV